MRNVRKKNKNPNHNIILSFYTDYNKDEAVGNRTAYLSVLASF